MTTITGSCLCGAVAYELEDDFQSFNLCHCKQCQRATGSVHASNLFTRPDNIRWKKGRDKVKRYDVPGRVISNAFCVECGSTLPYASKSGTAVIVPAGTLDMATRSELRPRHIFWSERADWYDAAQSAPRHDGFPE